MDDSQREVICTLLRHIYSLGLISKNTYSKAVDFVHSTTDIPEMFRYPAGLGREEIVSECTQNPQ